MANPEHLAKLKEGVEAWNEWRMNNPDIMPDLSGADLKGELLDGFNLSLANLSKADLSNAHLIQANFCAANMDFACLLNANVEEAQAIGANLTKSNLNRANLEGINLRDAKLVSAKMAAANLLTANLERANLFEADLSDANLMGTHLSFADLNNSLLSGANLLRADLKKASLCNAVLQKAELERADLKGADLSGADLKEANLKGADLREARLERTNLDGADLEAANIEGINLQRINFNKANLRNVRLSGCTIDKYTEFWGEQGVELGVNGIYCQETDSAALMQMTPPGNSMQGSNADAIVESLRHARKLHNISLSFAGIALLIAVFKPALIQIPFLISFKSDPSHYAVLAIFCSIGILTLTESFIRAALDGAQYINDRDSAMKVGHFPWTISKYDKGTWGKWQSVIMRTILCFHPLVYPALYFSVLSNPLFALFPAGAGWLFYLGNGFVVFAFLALLALCGHIFLLSQHFQKPILFDPETERNRKSDAAILNEKVSELIEFLKQKDAK